MKTVEQASPAGVFTLPLGSVRLKDLPRVGGKAAHLGELLAAGVPVPNGFVVTASACDRFLESDPRITPWLQSLEKCEVRDPAALHAAAEEFRKKLGAIPVPAEVVEAIAAGLAEASTGAWAVRSSATLEDSPGASFAGQHDSFLNMRGGEAVVAAVRGCWTSLFSERAISYRKRMGIPPGRAQMAVLVQQLVPADAAGVMFTADPADGDARVILIEAAFGLGQAVVQSKVAPDRIEISRSQLRVTRRQTALKRIQVVAVNEGVREQELAADRANQPVLPDETASRLARLGLEAERILGGPLDIEWCVCDGELRLLQARAVTALLRQRKARFADRQVWTNANAGEVLPDVVTPMTWSLVRQFLHVLFDRWLRVIGVQIEDDQLVGLVAGRGYFNFNTLWALSRLVPGANERGMEILFGGHHDALVALKGIKLSEADLPRIRVRRWKAAVNLPMIALQLLFTSTRDGLAAVDKVRRLNEDLGRLKPETLSDHELAAAIRTSFTPDALDRLGAIEAIRFAGVYYALLFGFGKRWFGADGDSITNRLLAAVGDMDDVEAGHELWQLAEQAAQEPEVRNALLSERTFGAFAARLEHCPGGRAFLDRWNTFMHRHGHHTRGEIELLNPRWSECPDFVLNLARGYVEGIAAGQPSPIARRERLAAERITLESDCLGRLRNPWQRAVFRFVLHRAQTGGLVRENLKSEMVRWLTFLRQHLLELGRRLAARGRLGEPNDVFFLEIGELESTSLWNAETDLRARIAPRRAEYERNLKINPPAVVVGPFDAGACVPDRVDHGKKVFHGYGVSTGAVTGRARVILRSDLEERLQPGEILVAPCTDPGWTPYFVVAAGIVMDLGGMLSHGSIVAREYGIPAVVNVGPATQIIRTGQWLEVDADRGLVKLLDTAPEALKNLALVQSCKNA